MKKTNYEDIIMKRAMDIFSTEGLKFFGINNKVKEVGPTELVVLDTKNMYMDYTFLMEDDTYLHFEFQTTDKGVADLMRFRTYEALLNYQTKKQVTTYVIYSGDIKNPIDEYVCGINTYKVNSISMFDKNGDVIYENVKNKINMGYNLDKEDMINLIFIPIMGGTLNKSEKILGALNLSNKVNNEYQRDIQSILYAFANKFLSGKDLEKVKEELSVTELGKMLVEEGIAEGKELGREEEKKELAKKAILKGMENDIIQDLTDLTIEQIEKLRKALSE